MSRLDDIRPQRWERAGRVVTTDPGAIDVEGIDGTLGTGISGSLGPSPPPVLPPPPPLPPVLLGGVEEGAWPPPDCDGEAEGDSVSMTWPGVPMVTGIGLGTSWPAATTPLGTEVKLPAR